MQSIAPEYSSVELRLKPGDRLHRLIALLLDTYCDDLSDDRIADLERRVESWRWCNAAGQRTDNPDHIPTDPHETSGPGRAA